MVRLINNNNDNNNKTKEGKRERRMEMFGFLATIATEDNEIRHEKQSICTQKKKGHREQMALNIKEKKFSIPFFPTYK
jgi:hypothetical protein